MGVEPRHVHHVACACCRRGRGVSERVMNEIKVKEADHALPLALFL